VTEYLVKAHWVTSAASFLQIHFPPEVCERARQSLSGDVRRAFSELEPIQWCPRSHHIEIMNAIASAKRTEAGAYEDLVTYGQYVASQRLDGPLRPLMQIVTLKLFAKTLPKIWARDHQDDSHLEVDIAPIEEGRLPVQIRGTQGYSHSGVVMLGWIKQAISLVARRPVHVKQRGWSLDKPAPDEISGEVYWS
jgi:hypothetical protein